MTGRKSTTADQPVGRVLSTEAENLPVSSEPQSDNRSKGRKFTLEEWERIEREAHVDVFAKSKTGERSGSSTAEEQTKQKD